MRVRSSRVQTGTNVNPHLWNFFRAVKTSKPVAEDAVFRDHAAIACLMVNESSFRNCPVKWNEAGERSKAENRRGCTGQACTPAEYASSLPVPSLLSSQVRQRPGVQKSD